MGRPHKSGVDFFSHDADASTRKTIFTLENQFGNDGYAFWFKLLEMLAQQDGLYLDCRNPAEWLYLVAKTRVSEETATEIMNTLARIDAIDAELWAQKIVWVQKFVERLEGVYKKRETKTPQKPSFCSENSGTDSVSASESTQSKVKESTVKNCTNVCSHGTHEGDSQKSTQIHADYPPEFEQFWQNYPLERRKEKKAACRAWKARVKAGAKPEQLIRAATLYAQECIGKEARYIKLPKTFLGPDDHWQEYQKPRGDPQQQFTHQHSVTDLQQVIQRKTMVGLNDFTHQHSDADLQKAIERITVNLEEEEEP